MGFQIWLLAVEGGTIGKFDRMIAERAFRDIVDSVEGGCWQIVLPDGPCFGQVHIDDATEVDGFTIERPPFTPTFLDALFEVMRQTPTVLTWPGLMGPNPICCVANVAVISELPDDLKRDWIPPAIVTCGADIEDCIIRNA